jgi:hypothetical protein
MRMRFHSGLPHKIHFPIFCAAAFCASAATGQGSVLWDEEENVAKETNCADGVDEDGDTVTDCADADCFAAEDCMHKDGSENSNDACQDFLDNDDDGYLDCEDHDCQVESVTVCVGSWGVHVPINYLEEARDEEGQSNESTFEEDTRDSKSPTPLPEPEQKTPGPGVSEIKKIGIPALLGNILAGFDGFVFKSDDRGESWRPVLSFPRGQWGGGGLGLKESGASQGSSLHNALPPREAPDPLGADLDSNLEGEDWYDDEDLEDSEEDWGDEEEMHRAKDDDDWSQDPFWMPEGDDDISGEAQEKGRWGKGVRRIRYLGASHRSVYVATPQGLFRSDDGGEEFTYVELPGGYETNDVRDVVAGAEDPQRLWVGTRIGLLVSQDGGQHFSRARGRAGRTPMLSLWTGASEENNQVLLGTEEGVMRSWNGGEDFHDLLLQGVGAYEPVHAVAFDPRGEVTYAGTTRGLFVSERSQPILERRAGGEEKHVASIVIDPQRAGGLVFGFFGEGLFFSEDKAISMLQIGRDLPAATVSGIDHWRGDEDTLFLATDRGVFVYEEGTGISVNINRIRALEDIWYREPTLPETMSLALQHSQLQSDIFYSAFKRAGWSAYAPNVSAKYQYTIGRPEEQEEYVLLVDEPDDFDDEDQKDYLELYDVSEAARAPYRGQIHAFIFLCTWDLDQLAFSGDRLSIMRLNPTRHRAEMQVLGRVQGLYTARRRLVTEMVLQGKPESERLQVAQWLRLAELTALVNGATGGGFSKIAHARGADERFITILESNSPKEYGF